MRRAADACDSMTYAVIAVGWVPNLSRTVTSVENIAEKICGSENGMTFEFDPDVRMIAVYHKIDGFPMIWIHPVDDSGQCELLIEADSGHAVTDGSDIMGSFNLMHFVHEVWMTFRGHIDSSTDPEYSDPGDDAYITEVSRQAVCSAMDSPILISEIESRDKWADAIVERFIQHDEALIDDLRSCPRMHRIWSNPKHIWNSRKAIKRALGLSLRSYTNTIYFRSFIDIYGQYVTELETVKKKLELRNERITSITRFTEGYLGYTNLRWLPISIGVAIGIGLISIAIGLASIG